MNVYDIDEKTGKKLIPIIEQLPELYKDVIYLMIVEQLSVRTVAVKLRLNVHTTSTRINRGMKKLEEILILPKNSKLVSANVRSKLMSSSSSLEGLLAFQRNFGKSFH